MKQELYPKHNPFKIFILSRGFKSGGQNNHIQWREVTLKRTGQTVSG